MGHVTWTEESLRWLEDIFEYIATNDPVAARKTVIGIHVRTRILREHPIVGHRYDASVRHVRILMYGHYRIAYLVKDGENIDILGVFHGALDIERYSL